MVPVAPAIPTAAPPAAVSTSVESMAMTFTLDADVFCSRFAFTFWLICAPCSAFARTTVSETTVVEAMDPAAPVPAEPEAVIAIRLLVLNAPMRTPY